MANLFQRIKKAKFYMPNYISDEAKDLITKLLQPLPLKRITISEIKEHPWFRKDLPLYLENMLSQSTVNSLRNKSSYIIETVDMELVE